MYWKDGGVGKADSLAWQRVLGEKIYWEGLAEWNWTEQVVMTPCLGTTTARTDSNQPQRPWVQAKADIENEWMNEWSCNYSARIERESCCCYGKQGKKDTIKRCTIFVLLLILVPPLDKNSSDGFFWRPHALPAAVHAVVLEVSEKRTRGCVYTWQWKMNDGCIKLVKQRKLAAARWESKVTTTRLEQFKTSTLSLYGTSLASQLVDLVCHCDFLKAEAKVISMHPWEKYTRFSHFGKKPLAGQGSGCNALL